MKKEVFLGLLVSLFLVGCNRSRQEQTERFSVATIQPKPVSETASLRKFPFLAKPYHETELAFRINGPLTGFSVRSGQYFRKGQVILELDKRDFRIRLQRCEAVLQQKEAEYKRVAALYAKQNISGTAYEAAKAAYEVARSNYDEARNALTDTDLRAPFDGFVQEVYVEPYQEVRSAQSVLSFVETDKLIAEVFVPQDVALAFLQQTDDWKKQVKICFDIAKDSVLVPSDCFLSKTTADNNLAYLLTAIVDNSDRKWLGGMSGQVALEMQQDVQNAWILPQQAVCHDAQNGDFVFLVRNGCAARCPITLVRVENGQAFVQADWSEQDTVVLSRQSFLNDGSLLLIEQ